MRKELGLEILALPMDQNDADADTVGGYLEALLTTLLDEGEGFSGKRPFGNSGWEYDLFKPLIVAGLCDGKLDSEGCIDSVDQVKAPLLILKAIKAAFAKKP
jgi:hypothetical protein